MKELNSKLKISTEIPLHKATILNILFSSVWVKDFILMQLKPYDLSIEQFNVLRILRGQKGNPINLQNIQERMVTKMSNATRLVDKLILKEFAERTICKENRRKVEILITKKGLDILKIIDPIIERVEKEITSELNTKELETLNKLLDKLKL